MCILYQQLTSTGIFRDLYEWILTDELDVSAAEILVYNVSTIDINVFYVSTYHINVYKVLVADVIENICMVC